MKINEIFCALSGESKNVGLRTVFVRTYGCNARCSYCFGPNKYGRYPEVTLPDLSRKPLNEVEEGDTILTFDDDFNIVETTIKEIGTRITDEYHVLSTMNTSFVVTPEHPVWIDGQWVPVKDIKIGQSCKNATLRDYCTYILNEYRYELAMYAEKCVSLLDNDYENSGIVNVGSHNGNHDPLLSNYEKIKKCIAKGIATMDIINDEECQTLVVHHIDGNHDNDTFSNLAIISKNFHDKLHGRGASFWSKSSKVKPYSGVPVVRNSSNAVSKQIGQMPKEVINLSCSPYNTFLVDDIYVHNCDTLYAIEGGEFTEMTVDEIVTKVDSYCCSRILLTGGEPLLQPDALDLVKELVADGYDVEIETNGAVDISPYVEMDPERVLITMDWKCPSSGMNQLMLKDNLDLLRFTDAIKFVVADQKDIDEMNRISGLTAAETYVSPVFGKIEPKEIAEYIVNNQLNDTRLQLQQHKILYDPDMRGV